MIHLFKIGQCWFVPAGRFFGVAPTWLRLMKLFSVGFGHFLKSTRIKVHGRIHRTQCLKISILGYCLFDPFHTPSADHF